MNQPTQYFSLGLIAATVAALVACGGGGGVAPTISGVVATGAPVKNGKVDLKCAVGKASGMTDATNGSYSVDASGLIPPCMVEVTKDTLTLHSVTTGYGTTNVTPVTELMVASLYNGNTSAFSTLDTAQLKDVVTASNLTAAKTSVQTYLTSLGAGTLPADPIAGTFEAVSGNDPYDKVLQSLTTKLGTTTLAAAGASVPKVATSIANTATTTAAGATTTTAAGAGTTTTTAGAGTTTTTAGTGTTTTTAAAGTTTTTVAPTTTTTVAPTTTTTAPPTTTTTTTTSTTTTTTAGPSATNGKSLYASNGVMACGTCHGTPPNAAMNKTLAHNSSLSAEYTALSGAINAGSGGMSMYSGKLTTPQIYDIAAYLLTPNI